ncbi:suppressor of cytokine signaling 7-like [Oncorhynchus keta]|uniref:suppressor of cytokine signaling 7-like n=1 Tax=Oncorhynchus keta TaxID=8018 RepID=UPI00227AF932|nr:suppressor of cytokine signaling 7-like [Oncorhynchus keta]
MWDSDPRHLRHFFSQQEYLLVRHPHRQLVHSGYYWGWGIQWRALFCMMVRDTLAGTTVEPSQNHTAPTQNRDGTQQLPGETLEHVEQQNHVQEQQNQLLELENVELLGQENELLEQQNLEHQIQLLELENTVQTSTDNRTTPPDKTSSGGALHPWWPQQSSFKATRPSVPLPSPSPSVPLRWPSPSVPLRWPSPSVPLPSPSLSVPLPCPSPSFPLPWPSPSVPLPGQVPVSLSPGQAPVSFSPGQAPVSLPWPSPSVPLPCLGPLLHLPDPPAGVSSQCQLVHSGYYWGPMEMEEAHRTLQDTPPGSFLIRDSSQPDVFFTLSYHGDRGPVSVRVLLTSQSFRLNGSNKAFDSLFSLLRFYVESSHRRLRRAWRRERPMTLQQLCRGRIVELYGAERIDSLPGLNQVVIQYLQDYPYSI